MVVNFPFRVFCVLKNSPFVFKPVLGHPCFTRGNRNFNHSRWAGIPICIGNIIQRCLVTDLIMWFTPIILATLFLYSFREDKSTWKSNYFLKLLNLLDEYPKFFIVGADNVGYVNNCLDFRRVISMCHYLHNNLDVCPVPTRCSRSVSLFGGPPRFWWGRTLWCVKLSEVISTPTQLWRR